MKALLTRSYTPIEKNETGRCIWCGQVSQFNKSHILSESLVTKNNPNNYLKKSVCISCNIYFSKVEGWLLNYSPLLVLKGDKWGKLQQKISITRIPIFFFHSLLEGWFVVHIKQYIEILPQIILTSENKILFAYFENDSGKIDILTAKLKENEFKIDIKSDLPNDFCPRVVFVENQAIAICKSNEDLNKLFSKFNSNKNDSDCAEMTKIPTSDIKGIESLIMYFKWSPTIWTIYNIKIAFEWFALQFGSETALDKRFDPIRKWVLFRNINDINDIISITGNIEKLQFDFEYDELTLDFIDDSFNSIPKTEINKGGDIAQLITNENNIIESHIRIGWLPPLNLILSRNFLDLPVFNFISYEFESSEIFFIKLATMKNKNHLLLFNDRNNPVSLTFYKDHIIEIPSKSP